MDLAESQDAFTAIFHTLTLRTRSRTPEVSSACGYAARGGVIHAGDPMRERRWAATVALPARTTLALVADEEVTIDEHPGRIYRVVHAPAAGSLNLERTVGVVEV